MIRLLSLWVLLGVAQAAPPATSYEQRHIDAALAQAGLTRMAPGPEPLAFVEVVRFDVFRAGELIPTVFNLFHWTTLPETVRRELRLRPGTPWRAEHALEAERVLRRIGIFQLVRVLPARDAEGRPGALVVTRDLWSLRFEQSFRYTAGQFDTLTLQLSERNLFGRAKRATARFNLTPLTWALGETYIDRRMFGGRLRLEQRLDVYATRDGGTYDGLDTAFDLSLPFHNLDQRWGFFVPIRYLDRTRRLVSAGEVIRWDDPDTEAEEAIARVWDQRYFAASAYGRYQLPGRWTHRFSLGVVFSDYSVSPNAETGLPAANRASFERAVLPRALRQVSPRLSWNVFERRYRTFHDLRSFGVSEDARLGPAAYAAIAAPRSALGSDIDALRFEAGLGYTLAWGGDGLLDLLVAGEARREEGAWLNQVLLTRLRWATPNHPWGRLVSRVDWQGLRNDTTNRLVTLGGDNGLRGYPSQFFFAQSAHRLRSNLEYRSPAWVLSWLHLGGVLFYDAGDVYPRAEAFTLRQAVGLGARVLFPQFNREPFRFDVALPVDGSAVLLRITAGSQQAVPLTPEEDRGFGRFVGGFENEP